MINHCDTKEHGEFRKEPIEIPVVLVRDTLEIPVNDKRDLFVQTTGKRKAGSIRFEHSIFHKSRTTPVLVGLFS